MWTLVHLCLLSFSFFLGKWMAGWLGGILHTAEASASVKHGGEIQWRQRSQRAMGKASGIPPINLNPNMTNIFVYIFIFYSYLLQLKIPEFFKDVEIVPALLHGDLWGGNVAECAEGPIIFDPASFYGHSEYELGIAGMFGGFSSSFYSAYHDKIPKAPGFAKRNQLYQLFHYLNHWNHFGGGYRGSSIRIMKDLLK